MKTVARISFYYALIFVLLPILLFIALFALTRSYWTRKFTSKIVQLMLFARIKKVGEPDPQAQMYIVNHASAFDISVMEITTPQPLAWVAKKELFDFPLLGLSLRLPRDIPLIREDKTSLVSLLKDAKSRVDEGRVITIFPEGTRSPRHKLLPFKAGAQMVANKLKLRVQPVVLVGTGHIFNSNTKEHHPGTVKAVFMDAFEAPTQNKEWLKELRSSMQEVYDRELADLNRHR